MIIYNTDLCTTHQTHKNIAFLTTNASYLLMQKQYHLKAPLKSGGSMQITLKQWMGWVCVYNITFVSLLKEKLADKIQYFFRLPLSWKE
jgi:hypothetical protein